MRCLSAFPTMTYTNQFYEPQMRNRRNIRNIEYLSTQRTTEYPQLVFQRKNKKYWTARIKFNDRHVELGSYDDEEKAAALSARIAAGDGTLGSNGPARFHAVPCLFHDTAHLTVF